MPMHEDDFTYLHHLGSSQFQVQGNLILQTMRLLVEQCSLVLDSLLEFYEEQVPEMKREEHCPLDLSPEKQRHIDNQRQL